MNMIEIIKKNNETIIFKFNITLRNGILKITNYALLLLL